MQANELKQMRNRLEKATMANTAQVAANVLLKQDIEGLRDSVRTL